MNLDITARDLRKAAKLKEKLDTLEAKLSRLLNGAGSTRRPGRPSRGKMNKPAKAAIARALIKIRQQTGADPKDLRRLSSHLERTDSPQASTNDSE
jgi:hypothetical protein